MKTYNVEYKIGMFGCINIDVEMELPRDHPDFKRVLNEKADEIVQNEVMCYGCVDFIHTRDWLWKSLVIRKIGLTL